MEDYPKTTMEFEKRFNSERPCQEELFQLRWPNVFRCPRCQHKEAWTTDRELYHCRKCGLQTSVTAGTISQSTRKPLRLWLRAMWYITNQKYGVSTLGLQRALGLNNYRTALTWMQELRHAMVRLGRDRLSGISEVDETYIGGEKPRRRGRGAADKVLVVIAARVDDTRIGRIRLQRVSDASGNSLEKAVQETVEPGSIVRTDGWNGYSTLNSMGYVHKKIVREEATVGKNLLPRCSIVASLLKRWLLGTHHGVSPHFAPWLLFG